MRRTEKLQQNQVTNMHKEKLNPLMINFDRCQQKTHFRNPQSTIQVLNAKNRMQERQTFSILNSLHQRLNEAHNAIKMSHQLSNQLHQDTINSINELNKQAQRLKAKNLISNLNNGYFFDGQSERICPTKTKDYDSNTKKRAQQQKAEYQKNSLIKSKINQVVDYQMHRLAEQENKIQETQASIDLILQQMEGLCLTGQSSCGKMMRKLRQEIIKLADSAQQKMRKFQQDQSIKKQLVALIDNSK